MVGRSEMTVVLAALVMVPAAWPGGAHASGQPATTAKAAATTIWPGWEAVGDLSALTVTGLAVSGPTTLRVSEGEAPVPFVLDGPGGTRVGSFPGGVPTIVTPDRLIALSQNCLVHRSDDRGTTWTSSSLPSCDVPYSERLTAVFADADRGLISASSGTWGTDDGGLTWTQRNATRQDTLGRTPLLLGPSIALRTVVAGKGEMAVQRTADGGVTWTAVALPPAEPPVSAPPSGDPPVVDPSPTAPAVAPPTTAPSLSAPVRRADGAVVVGSKGAVLVSTDGGLSFTRTAFPDAVGGSAVAARTVVCDAVAVSCLLGIDVAGATPAVRFQDGGFSSTLPGLPAIGPQSPLAGVVVGLDASPGTVRRSSDGGASYTTDGRAFGPNVGGRGLVANVSGDRLSLSSDSGVTRMTVPAPVVASGESLVKVVRGEADDLLAITQKTLHRYAAGGWKSVADVSAVWPTGLAVLDGQAIVVGERGVLRVGADGNARPISASVLAGRSFRSVAVRGRQVVLWSRKMVVRSTDGGRRWRTVKGVPSGGVEDVQLLGPRSFVAVRGEYLYRSTVDGQRLRLRGVTPRVREWGNGSASTVELAGDGRGTVRTARGAFRTDDGGRRFVPVPIPVGANAKTVARVGGATVAQFGTSGILLRTTQTGKAPSLAARRVGRPQRAGRSNRRVTIVGRIRGAPAGAEVVLVTYGSRNEPGVPSASVTVNADGTYRRAVQLSRREGLVRAWYAGAATTSAATSAAASPYLSVPKLPAPKPKSKAKRK